MAQSERGEQAGSQANSDPTNPDAERRSAPVAWPIALLMVAILCGAGSLILVVFGAWPAIVLVLASAFTGWLAVRRIKQNKPESMA